jgi:hypothetical protein
MGTNLGSDENRAGALPTRFVGGSIPGFDSVPTLLQARLRVFERVRQLNYRSLRAGVNSRQTCSRFVCIVGQAMARKSAQQS